MAPIDVFKNLIVKNVRPKMGSGSTIFSGVLSWTKTLLALTFKLTRVRLSATPGKQAEGVPRQVTWDYTRQTEEQPSPLLMFPSSHNSPPLIIPSPQTAARHGSEEFLQKYPDSMRHWEEHPSPFTIFLSSHD